MLSLESFIEKFSDEDLEICFNEIVEWRKEGMLQKESIVHKVWEQYKIQGNNDTYPIHMMPEAIFFEICKRKYEGDKFNKEWSIR